MISFKELCKEMQGQRIPYSKLLTTIEWNEKRSVITRRDHHCCTNCGKGETMSEFDEKRHETWHFWPKYLEDVWVKQEDGTYEEGDTLDFEIAPKHYHMQVHHVCYIRNRLPWEYSNNYLVTLCNWCHWEFHQEYKVYVLEEDEESLAAGMEPCPKCHGTGSFPEYSHIQEGVCFRCGGDRYELPLVEIRG
ncbi:hypothetical protein ACFS7Z_22255 [Pontibacter toksunensis]|uniref:HNH endonuclease n=1 Tax=Pontibacter toksunensis TaxID=1332631 RepID=A0ABW6C1G1_9BACT